MSDELVRFIIATSEIRGNHMTVGHLNDEKTLVRRRYQHANEYWQVAMSEPVDAAKFIGLLETWLLDPERFAEEQQGRKPKIANVIRNALRVAIEGREPWITTSPTPKSDVLAEAVIVRPDDAARWLLNKPMRHDLVPPGLRVFLEHGEDDPLQAPTVKAKPGPKSREAEMKTTLEKLLAEGNNYPTKKAAWNAVINRLGDAGRGISYTTFNRYAGPLLLDR